AARFPGGAGSTEQYWQMLEQGRDAVIAVPRSRWSVEPLGAGSVEPAQLAVRWGAFLREDIRLFDAAFFGISPPEARAMDPQQRLLLEVAWEALERAGQTPERLMGSRTGVFVGIATTDYGELLMDAGAAGQEIYAVTGNGHCFPSGRLSFTFGLEGPS